MSGYVRKNLRKDGYVWQAVVNLGLDSSGKRLRDYKTFPVGTTKKHAERVLQEMILAVHNQEHVRDSSVTVQEFLQEWLDVYNRGNSPRTVSGYRDIIENYLIPEFGRTKLKDLTTLSLQKYYNRLYECSPLSGKPMAKQTVRNIATLFKSALQKAVQLDILKKNPMQNVELQKVKRYQSDSDVFDMTELAQVLASLKGTDLECSVQLILLTGIRRGEALSLRFDRVDFLNSTITIDCNVVKVGTQLITKSPKTDSSIRKIDVPYSLMKLLEKERNNYEERRLKFGKDFHDTNLVISKPNGEGFKPDSFTQKFRRFLKERGFKASRVIHSLRHQNATLMLRAGVNPKVMQKRLGHSNYSTTMDIYSHVLAESERNAVRLLESSLESIVV